MGALDEAALLVARDPDTTDVVATTFERLVDGLLVPVPESTDSP
jgi:hypothetical protein